jgi:NDP-sugar pyrophosphorylase family protein
MTVLILAGGKGTRLKPYTTVIPKPLMPIGDYSILEVILHQLRDVGVDHVVLAVGYLSHLFQAVFGDGRQFGLKISYLFEKEPLGTAGAISAALPMLGEDFLVMNGDVLTTLDFDELFAFHQSHNADATVAVNRREVAIDFGVIEMNAKEELAHYIEKPKHQFHVSMGINVLKTKAIKPFLRPGVRLDMPDLMTTLKTSGHKVCCFTKPCYWLDIGRTEDFETAQRVFAERKTEFISQELERGVA